MSFAENLKTIRKKNNLSQEKLAEILSVSRQCVTKWESGACFPEIENLLELSQKFSVSIDWLFKDTLSPTITEDEVLWKLGIDSFADLTVERMHELKKYYSLLDSATKTKAIEQIQDFSNTIRGFVNQYKGAINYGVFREHGVVRMKYELLKVTVNLLESDIREEMSLREKMRIFERAIDLTDQIENRM